MPKTAASCGDIRQTRSCKHWMWEPVSSRCCALAPTVSHLTAFATIRCNTRLRHTAAEGGSFMNTDTPEPGTEVTPQWAPLPPAAPKPPRDPKRLALAPGA